MSFPNIWHHRKVADTSAKACEVCFKPSTSVLITPEKQDFFYVCAGHLGDRGFCSPIVDEAAVAAKKKQREMEEELERVKKEYEDKQRKKKEKEAGKQSESEKDKDKDKKKEDDKDAKKPESRDEPKSEEKASHFLYLRATN
ncbi:DUF1742-domain-containing protein [Xylariomycetidae sp. FL2044]|nr:DUF1742-domain-containing protein [Xylariomycetidae sp. FL2044]